MKLEYDPLMVRRKVVLGTFKQFLLEKTSMLTQIDSPHSDNVIQIQVIA